MPTPGEGQILGLGLGALAGAMQNQSQQNLMGIQQQNQMALNEQGAQIARDNWDYTNYENQVKHMKNAGLNVGLMYGQSGGGGGTLSSGSGGGASGGQAANMGMMLQGAMMQSQTEVNKAQARNLNADADVKEGKNPRGEQEVINLNTTGEGLKLDNALKSGNIQNIIDTSAQVLENEKAKNKILVNEGKISESDANVRDRQNSVEILNKIMNTKQMSEGIKQKWEDLKIAQQNADTNSKNADTNYKNYLQNEVKNKIEEFKANLQSEYPGIQNTMGKAINDLMRWIEGDNESDARKVKR